MGKKNNNKKKGPNTAGIEDPDQLKVSTLLLTKSTLWFRIWVIKPT